MVSWLMTIKAVLISTGVASVGLLLKVSVPLAVDFSVSQAPIIWSSLLSWLKPPYLYILTNGIIITIVASSKYYRSTSHHDEEDDGIVYGGGGGDDYKLQTEVNNAQFGFIVATPPSPQLEPEEVTSVVYGEEKEAEEEEITDAVTMVEEEDEIEPELENVTVLEGSGFVGTGDGVMLPPANSYRNNLPKRMTESENLPPSEKPLVSSRFGHRKSVKASQQGTTTLYNFL